MNSFITAAIIAAVSIGKEFEEEGASAPITTSLITSSTTNNTSGYKLDFTHNFVDGETEEDLPMRFLIGTMVLTTSDVQADAVHFGVFNLPDPNWEDPNPVTQDLFTGWDGFRITTNALDPSLSGAAATTTIEDMYHASKPDIYTSGMAGSGIAADVGADQQDYVLTAFTSSCDSGTPDVCTLTASFYRQFRTLDTMYDHFYAKELPNNFTFFGWYEAGADKGQGADVVIPMGALSGISFAFAAITTSVFAVVF